MDDSLTIAQAEVLKFMWNFYKEKKYMPTMKDIKDETERHGHWNTRVLWKKGYIDKPVANASRAWRFTDKTKELLT